MTTSPKSAGSPELAHKQAEGISEGTDPHRQMWRPTPWLCAAAVVGLLAVFVYIATRNIKSPGLYYDELDFVNAALGHPAGSQFISTRIFGVPVMIMPYIGALKSYLYHPVFALFGVSAVTIRLPIILVAAVGLFVWYEVGVLIYRTRVTALFMLAALSVDPAYIFQAKLDWGPTVLQVVLSGVLTYSVLRAVRGSTSSAVRIWLPLAYVAALLGLFNKLNFIWIIVALPIAIGSVYPARVRNWFRSGLLFLLPLGATTALVGLAGWFLILPIITSSGPAMGLLAKVQYTASLYNVTMNGNAVFGYITGGGVLASTSWTDRVELWVTAAWVVALAFTVRRLREDQKEALRTTAFFAVVFVVIAAQIVLTKQATGPYHIMALWPINVLVIFLMVEFIALCAYGVAPVEWRAAAGRLVQPAMVAITSAALLCGSVIADNAYNAAFAQGTTLAPIWSDQIYQLSTFINTLYPTRGYVLFPDWGIDNQALALASSDGERVRLLDGWPWFSNPGPSLAVSNSIFETYFEGRTDMVVMFKNVDVIPGTKANFWRFAKVEGLTVTQVDWMPLKDKPVYAVYMVSPAPGGANPAVGG